MYELPRAPSAFRSLTDEESDRLRRQNPALPGSPSDCPTCNGKGTFDWYADADRDEVVEWKCNCPDQWLMHRYFLYHGVELAYQRLAWPDALHADPGALEAAMDYLDHAEEYLRAGIGFIFHGEQGTGKTLLSVLMLKRLMAEGADGYLTTFPNLLSTLMAGFDDPEERSWYHRRIKNAGVLVIDDIGKEHHKTFKVKGEGVVSRSTAISQSAIDAVIRHRVAGAKPTIITTNLDLDSIERSYGDNIISLLSEFTDDHRFDGQDFRKRAKDLRLEEARAGLVRPIVVG